ncbi:MAG: phosphoribosylformylglycinamidine synthase subunit PurS [Kineosporiaceae bacterium]
MPTVVVEVMPKPELLDPQGKAVTAALQRLGFDGLAAVRQGKRFEIEVDEMTPEVLAAAQRAAEEVLANPVIEDVVVVGVPEGADDRVRLSA